MLNGDLKVAHPLMVRAIAAAKKKNDRIDASKICDCLRCDFLPESYMASTTIRQRRRTLRYRNLVVRYAVQMKTKISALLNKRRTPETILGSPSRLWASSTPLICRFLQLRHVIGVWGFSKIRLRSSMYFRCPAEFAQLFVRHFAQSLAQVVHVQVRNLYGGVH